MKGKCFNCGINYEEWNCITEECSVQITLTKTEKKDAYILLRHNDVVIGSFDGLEFSYHKLEKTPNGFNKSEYKVIIRNEPMYHQYFQVYHKTYTKE